MKRFIPVILLVCLGYAVSINADMGGAGASPEWGKLQKKVVVRTGLSVSAWDNDDNRADVTLSQYGMRAATMVPVGDGTYQIKFLLQPGVPYNFEFFAVSTQTLPGITQDYTYYDPVPNTGTDFGFVTSTDPVNPALSNTKTAGYTSVNGDGRRYVYIPDWLEPSSTYYVYCNWGSVPQPPPNFGARPGNNSVSLSWTEPYAYWGSGNEAYKAIDIIAGGVYHILRSTVSAAGPFDVIATTPGFCFSYMDSSVVNGRNYYYAIISSDAYKGAGNQADTNLVSGTTAQPGLTAAFARPGEAIPIRFRVENIDWKVVEKEKFVVWLTPDNAVDKYSRKYKTPASIVKVYVKKTIVEKLRDWVKWITG